MSHKLHECTLFIRKFLVYVYHKINLFKSRIGTTIKQIFNKHNMDKLNK